MPFVMYSVDILEQLNSELELALTNNEIPLEERKELLITQIQIKKLMITALKKRMKS